MAKLLKRFNSNTFLLIALLFVAAFLRLYRIGDYLVFLGDEGRDALVVKHIIEGFQAVFSGNLTAAADGLTLLGPTSSVGGFFLGPFYYYFITPALWIAGFDPVGPAIMVALIGVATVFLLYKVAQEFFDTKMALITAGLYACSPLVVLYSRSSWNPNVMPFFTLLLMYVLYKAVVRKSWILLFLVGILYGIVMQLHYLAVFIGPIIVVYLAVPEFLYNRTKEKTAIFIKLVKEYLLIAGGFLLSLSPWILFELRHGLLNIRNIVTFIFASKEVSGGGNFFEIIGTVLFRIFARLIFAFPPMEELPLFPTPVLIVWGIVAKVISLYVLFQLIKKLIATYKARSEEFYIYFLLSLWLFLGILFFGFYQKSIYDYYFAFLFPVPFLIIAYGVSIFLKRYPWAGRTLIMLLPILAALYVHGLPTQKYPNRQLAQARLASEFILEKADNKPFNFALITGGNSDHAYRYFFEIHNKKAVVLENTQIDPKRKTATDQLFVVCESVPCHPLGYPVWEVAGFGRAEIVDEWDVSILKIYKLKHYTGNN